MSTCETCTLHGFGHKLQIRLCPLHAAALALLEALEQILIWAQNGKDAQQPQCRGDQRSNAERLALIEGEARAAIAQAKNSEVI